MENIQTTISKKTKNIKKQVRKINSIKRNFKSTIRKRIQAKTFSAVQKKKNMLKYIITSKKMGKLKT